MQPYPYKMAHWTFFSDTAYGHGHADTDTDDMNNHNVFKLVLFFLFFGYEYADPDRDKKTWNANLSFRSRTFFNTRLTRLTISKQSLNVSSIAISAVFRDSNFSISHVFYLDSFDKCISCRVNNYDNINIKMALKIISIFQLS